MNWNIWKWVIGAVVVIAMVISIFVVRTMTRYGQFTSMTPAFSGESCIAMEAVPGPEDIAIDRKRGIAFVAAYDRRPVYAGAPGSEGIRGGIYLIDLKVPDSALSLRPVTPLEPEDFRPHGISLYEAPDGSRTLMAVNHPKPGIHTVEIFDVDDDNQLTLRQTVSDPLIVSPNDVAAVTADTFYVTNDNDNPFNNGLLARVAFAPEDTTVAFFDGTETQVAATGFVSANGVALSRDGAKVYVADMMGQTLKIFDRDPENDALTLADSVYIGTGLDNIDVAEDGSLWIAAHPKLLKLFGHAGDPESISPSHVIRVVPGAEGGGEVRTIYLNDGSEISASTVAATYKDRMLVGTVFDSTILACRMGETGADGVQAPPSAPAAE